MGRCVWEQKLTAVTGPLAVGLDDVVEADGGDLHQTEGDHAETDVEADPAGGAGVLGDEAEDESAGDSNGESGDHEGKTLLRLGETVGLASRGALGDPIGGEVGVERTEDGTDETANVEETGALAPEVGRGGEKLGTDGGHGDDETDEAGVVQHDHQAAGKAEGQERHVETGEKTWARLHEADGACKGEWWEDLAVDALDLTRLVLLAVGGHFDVIMNSIQGRLAVEEGLWEEEEAAEEYSASKNNVEPHGPAPADAISDVATDGTTNEGTSSEEDGVDSHGSTTLVDEEDLSNNIRSKSVCSSTSHTSEDACSKERVEATRCGSPDGERCENEQAEKDDRTASVSVGQWDPNNVRRAEHERVDSDQVDEAWERDDACWRSHRREFCPCSHHLRESR